MSPAPRRLERAPPPVTFPAPLRRPAILPPVRPASRSFVLAAARLRALHLDSLLTDGDQPLPRKGRNDRRPA